MSGCFLIELEAGGFWHYLHFPPGPPNYDYEAIPSVPGSCRWCSNQAKSPDGCTGSFITILKISSLCPRIPPSGCTDGMVGVLACVASVQVSWPPSGGDFSSHITALEAMLAEMQVRVRKKQSSSPGGGWCVLLIRLSAGPRSLLVRAGDPAGLGRGCWRRRLRGHLGESDGGRGRLQQDSCLLPTTMLWTGLCWLEDKLQFTHLPKQKGQTRHRKKPGICNRIPATLTEQVSIFH